MDAIRRIVRVLRETSRAAEQRFGVSGAQLFVLHQLHARGAQTIGELADATATHQSSVSVVVQRLVDAGLVRRSTSVRDRRRREVTLTGRGTKLLERAPGVAQEGLLAGLASLPPAELRRLARALTALVAAMGADEEPATMFFEDAAAKSMGSHGSAPRRRLRSPQGGDDAAERHPARALPRARAPRARRGRADPRGDGT
ncbi:MAG: MarR family transcriptional regulator [Deltaproteobacteria bacterium]|nr:MarR family transcriptional regulator [Kofleriaceae bacterium]